MRNRYAFDYKFSCQSIESRVGIGCQAIACKSAAMSRYFICFGVYTAVGQKPVDSLRHILYQFGVTKIIFV